MAAFQIADWRKGSASDGRFGRDDGDTDGLRPARAAGFDLAGAGLHQQASDVPGG